MNGIITIQNYEPRISHRIVAENTANKPQNIKELIDDYKADFEYFGIIRFKTEKSNNGAGRGKTTYYLNEQQATLLLTYLRNSEVVRKFKITLVKEFYKLKSKHNHYQINGYKSQIAQHNNKIRELEERLKLLPLKTIDEKIDLLLQQSKLLLNKKSNCSFTTFLQKHLEFYRQYVQILKLGGNELQQYCIQQIEAEKVKTKYARNKEVEIINKYNYMMNRIKSFIKASNQISLLEPIN